MVLRTLTFTRQLIRRPLQTASLVPSSRELAALMTSQLDPLGGPVVELGAGTGALTRALIEKGFSQGDIAAVEFNPVFAGGLRHDFPHLDVLEVSASCFPARLSAPHEAYQAVVSGLPLRAMRERQQQDILEAVFSVLQPGRSMYQFTYLPRRPVSAPLLARLGLACERIGVSWTNVPPAGVFRLYRMSSELYPAVGDRRISPIDTTVITGTSS